MRNCHHVPGYVFGGGARSTSVRELAQTDRQGITVKYADSSGGRTHARPLNVLLAEAEVPYDQVFEMRTTLSSARRTLPSWAPTTW
jgi:NAD/NADP transhydrogenase beta subunit